METIIFLCNGEVEYGSRKGIIKNKELPGLIKSVISSGEYYVTSWSCGNSRFIKVGDRSYLKRSGNIGNEPSGFIAAGHVIAAPKDEQLKLLYNKRYSNLSEAYVSDYDGCFFVKIQIDSVVDFDFPLEQKDLSKSPPFQGVNFNFGGSGCRFDSKAAPYLDSEWEKHSLIQHRHGRGRRLADIFLEQGDNFKQNKDYQAAINSYKVALQVDPKYRKAIERIKTYEPILKKVNTKLNPPEPTIVSESQNPSPELDNLLLAREELEK